MRRERRPAGRGGVTPFRTARVSDVLSFGVSRAAYTDSFGKVSAAFVTVLAQSNDQQLYDHKKSNAAQTDTV
jgi:hypothetical protein